MAKAEDFRIGANQRAIHNPPASFDLDSDASSCRLQVVVVFTSPDATHAAIQRANALLQGLNGHISLVDAQTVPFPLPIESPPVSCQFAKQRLQEVADKSATEISTHVYLCRFPAEALRKILAPGSLVLIGVKKRIWESLRSGREKELIRQLKRAGYQVITVGA